MNEQERLKELYSYHVLDTPPEKFLDELVELASLIFNTPVVRIALIDKDREWYKASKGVAEKGMDRANSFCQHTIPNPNEVLIVEDTLKDPRFEDNPLVRGEPNIRFYAGAPLETPNGYVLGTLCVMDTKPKKVTEEQKEALKILAGKAINHLNLRKKFSWNNKGGVSYIQEVLHLTDELPGVIYKFRMTREGVMKFDFFSEGITEMFPGVDPEIIKEDPVAGFSLMVPEKDVALFLSRIQISFEKLTPFEVQFRIIKKDNTVEWHLSKSKPKINADGETIWFGFFHNITKYKVYEAKMKQIAFDISHVIRKPVTTLLGLATLIEEDELTDQNLKEYSNYIKMVSKELETLTVRLDETYREDVTKFSGE